MGGSTGGAGVEGAPGGRGLREKPEKVAREPPTPPRRSLGHSKSSQRRTSLFPHSDRASTIPVLDACAVAARASSGRPVAAPSLGASRGVHGPAQEPVTGLEALLRLKKPVWRPSCESSTTSSPSALIEASTSNGRSVSMTAAPRPNSSAARWPHWLLVIGRLPQFTAQPHWLQVPSPPLPRLVWTVAWADCWLPSKRSSSVHQLFDWMSQSAATARHTLGIAGCEGPQGPGAAYSLASSPRGTRLRCSCTAPG